MTAIAPIQVRGVIGGGTMGAGIAQVAVQHGLRVILVEQSDERATSAAGRVEAGLAKAVDRGQITADDRAIAAGRLTTTASLATLVQAEIVIEAVFEDLSAKRAVASSLGAILGATAILATNTSSISIDRIADAFVRPEAVVGVHFFNPVPALPLVEIVVGERTGDAAVALGEQLARQLGKTPVQVKDRPGFVVNRLLIPMINEAALLLGEGVASAEAIDTAMRLGASHPLGPLALADLIGLDVCLAIMRTLAAELDGDRFAPAPALTELVELGHLGRKTGRGFHRYDR